MASLGIGEREGNTFVTCHARCLTGMHDQGGEMKLYLDGTHVATTTHTAPKTFQDPLLYLGVESAWKHPWVGELDEAKI